MSKEIPDTIIMKLKIIKNRYYDDKDIEEVKEIYFQEFESQKEKYSDQGWSDKVFHKRALTSLKNQKKLDSIGGSLDTYIGINLGKSKITDLASGKRERIKKKWENDPIEALNSGLVMFRNEENPETGEIDRVPILDDEGDIIPRDNNEYFNKKDGGKWKNPNYGSAIGHSYQRKVVGVCQDMQGEKGIFMITLKDKLATDIEIPLNEPVKFSGRTKNVKEKELEKIYLDKETVKERLSGIKIELEGGNDKITKEYYERVSNQYKNLFKNKDKIKTRYLELSSSRGTSYNSLSEKEIKKLDFPKKDGEIDVDYLYKEYMMLFSSDCAHLLEYHKDNAYLDEKKENTNWDEFVVLQDVNVIQKNTEASMSGNYTMYVEDDSLFLNEVMHNNNIIDSVRVLAPSFLDLNFGQDSRIDVIAGISQFQSQDDERNPIFEEVKNKETGKIEKVEIRDYPILFAYGIYPIPEFKIEIETTDLRHDEKPDIEETEENVELTKEETKEMEEIEKTIDKMEKKVKKKSGKKESKELSKEEKESEKESEEEPEDLDLEDEEEQIEIW